MLPWCIRKYFLPKLKLTGLYYVFDKSHHNKILFDEIVLRYKGKVKSRYKVGKTYLNKQDCMSFYLNPRKAKIEFEEE